MADLTPIAMLDALKRARTTGKQVEIADGHTRGLRFRASLGGTASFYLMYRPLDGSGLRRLRLSRLPLGGDEDLAKALSAARKAAAAELVKVAAGGDPGEARKQAKADKLERAARIRQEAQALADRKSVADVVELFLHEKRALRWINRYRQMLHLNLLAPELGLAGKAAADLTGDDIDKVLRGVVKRQEARREKQRAAGKIVPEASADTQAARVFEVIRAMVRFAAKKKLMRADIIDTVTRPDDGDARKRYLSVPELRATWEKLRAWDAAWTAGIPEGGERPPIPHNAVRVLRLQLLTGCRTGELAGLQKHEIAPKAYEVTIPAERCKNGFATVVPLSPEARAIVEAAVAASEHPQLVFPVRARDGGGIKALRSDVIAAHLLAAQSEFGFKDAAGKSAPFVAHDLRRSVATYLGKLGTAPEVVSAILNHKPKGVTKEHYDLNEYGPEKREALTRWQVTMENIAAGADPFAIDVQSIEALEARIVRELRGPQLTAIPGGRA